MAKKLRVATCGECPNWDHYGAFGEISRVPTCQKANRVLPYDVVDDNGRLTAEQKPGFPSWCPLEKY